MKERQSTDGENKRELDILLIKEWQSTVEAIAEVRLDNDVMYSDPDLLEDYVQDIWLELLTIKEMNPKISNAMLKDALEIGKSISKPDKRITYNAF